MCFSLHTAGVTSSKLVLPTKNQQLSHLRVAFLLPTGEGVGKTACSILYLCVLQGNLRLAKRSGNEPQKAQKRKCLPAQVARDDAARIVAKLSQHSEYSDIRENAL